MNKIILVTFALVLSWNLLYSQKTVPKEITTSFQTSALYKPAIHVEADIAIIYGVDMQEQLVFDGKFHTLEDRINSWREKGYITQFMTGISWGKYADYFLGNWDGKKHDDEGQMRENGEVIWHGKNVPYVVPTQNYLEYIKETQIKRAIDAGINDIYLEEPEFWAFGGYSSAFKKEWQSYYGVEWQPQHTSAESLYLSNKLKYHLYYRALEEVFTYAKEYGRNLGRTIKCYVPTHSLINYSQWQIVSPEASLASMDCMDGYIAQVWTGTARVPN
ncbi:MAG: hypothetical protein ACK5IC_02975, partial [Moheibacter sp.]